MTMLTKEFPLSETDWVKDKQPITSGVNWTPSTDAVSQNNWAIRVGSAINKTNIVQAGNWNDAPPKWGAAQLIATENATVKSYVRHYAHHNYPGGSIQSLMTHSNIAKNIHVFDADVAAARAVGKEYVLGETNSGTYLCRTPRPFHPSPFLFSLDLKTKQRRLIMVILMTTVSGGGAASVSPTFGAALWTMDYALRATSSNISRTYFHHGTVGNCQYCFWGRYSMGAPYYGAYAAAALMAGASHLAALDSGSSNYAGYATFDARGLPLRVLLYNSDYYAGAGTRSAQSFTLTGLTSLMMVRAKRLTAASATSRVDQGSSPTFGGQKFGDGSCVKSGTETFETVAVSGGQATFSVKATEALLVYLQ